jgi:hypothetical protein
MMAADHIEVAAVAAVAVVAVEETDLDAAG